MKNLKMLNPDTRKNASVENQLLALKEANTRQNLEIRGLKCKFNSLKKSIRLMEEKISKQENERDKEKRHSTAQTENKQEAENGFKNETNNLLHLRSEKLESAPPSHSREEVLESVPSQQESSNPSHKYPVVGDTANTISAPSSTKANETAKKKVVADTSPPRKAKRPRLDAASANPAVRVHMIKSLISRALETLKNSCSGGLPTDRIHALLNRTSTFPVLKEEEKAIIAEFCENESLAEMFLAVILEKIKAERGIMEHDLLQSLCRVYVGLCKERGDAYKAHILAYKLLKEDFPEATKLIMSMVMAWPSILSHPTSLCRSIHIVCKLKAKGKIFYFLSNYLNWNEEPSESIYTNITDTLKAFLEDSSLTFQKSRWYGYDLCPVAWNYILSLDLLCSQVGWSWTLNTIIRRELWLILKTWLMQIRFEETPPRGICLGAVFRLFGRLGQLGLKENLLISVQNLAKIIIEFGNRKFPKGMPLEVQLSVIYAIHDLAPSNPEEALKTLESWQQNITQPVPPAVTKCITQTGVLCQEITQKNS